MPQSEEPLPDLDFLKEIVDNEGIENTFQAIDNTQRMDPWMLWRSEVNKALAEEGINVSWKFDHAEEYVIVQPLVLDNSMRDYEKIPLIHLKEIFEHEDTPANPKGVAAYIKACLYEKRFRHWEYEQDE